MTKDVKFLFAHHGRNVKPDLETVRLFNTYKEVLVYAEKSIRLETATYIKKHNIPQTFNHLIKNTVGGKYSGGYPGILCWKITDHLGAKPVKNFKKDMYEILMGSKF